SAPGNATLIGTAFLVCEARVCRSIKTGFKSNPPASRGRARQSAVWRAAVVQQATRTAQHRQERRAPEEETRGSRKQRRTSKLPALGTALLFIFVLPLPRKGKVGW